MKVGDTACMECGHVFRTVAAAERARFGADGCPRCGGADIDEANEADVERFPVRKPAARAVKKAPGAVSLADIVREFRVGGES